MHSAVRDWIYRTHVEPTPELSADLHRDAAEYYHDHLFLRSFDLAAFFEFAFHHVTWLEALRERGLDQTRTFADGIRSFDARIQRARDTLLGGHTGTLEPWVETLQNSFVNRWATCVSPDVQAASRQLTKTLFELHSRVLRLATDFEGCLAILVAHVNAILAAGGADEGEIVKASRLSKLDRSAVDALEAAVGKIVAAQGTRGRRRTPQEYGELARNVQEMGVCLSGRHEYESARRVLELAVRLNQKAQGDSGASGASDGRDVELLKNEIVCHIRMVELSLLQIHPWIQPNDQGREDARLDEIGQRLKEAEQLAEKLPVLRGESLIHIQSYLNSVRAQFHYLHKTGHDKSKHFSLAYMRLDMARAAAYRAGLASDRNYLAIVQLNYAEALMLDAHVGVCSRTASSSRDEPDGWATAPVKLNRAEVALDQARIALSNGRRNVWNWTRYYVLKAQLHHERLLWMATECTLSFEPSRAKPELPPGVGDRAVQRIGELRVTAEVRAGLEAISAGLDNIYRDKIRRPVLESLWCQILTCFAFLRNAEKLTLEPWPAPRFSGPDGNELWQEWRSLNLRADLSRLLKNHSRSREHKRNGIRWRWNRLAAMWVYPPQWLVSDTRASSSAAQKVPDLRSVILRWEELLIETGKTSKLLKSLGRKEWRIKFELPPATARSPRDQQPKLEASKAGVEVTLQEVLGRDVPTDPEGIKDFKFCLWYASKLAGIPVSKLVARPPDGTVGTSTEDATKLL
jgi:hypothetical protein